MTLQIRSMKHTGSCDKQCGHALDQFQVRATPEVQRQLDRDPRVVEYDLIDDWFHVVYAYRRPVAAIYYTAAMQLRIKELGSRRTGR
jgi:hypothetical protein